MYKILLSISLAAIFGGTAYAQTAQDFFHRGAQYYIWNEKQKATNEIFSGLRLFPSDPQLNGLAALLKKEDQKQQQQNQQNQESKQDQKDQQQQQNQSQDKGQQDQAQQQNASKQDEQRKEDQKQQQAAQEKQQQQEQQKEQGTQGSEQQKNESGETNQQEYAAGQMTPDQARQLLDSQKLDEKMLPIKPEGERRKRLKDW